MEQKKMIDNTPDTIAAIATPAGTGGIAVIRISGPDAFSIVQKIWKGKPIADCPSHTLHLGKIILQDGSVLDEAIASLYAAPNSFTGENTVELSIHGSRWIQHQLMNELIAAGARAARPGEFSSRAFINGRMDLAQAEGVADIIAASSKAAHRLAMSQMSGSFSRRIDRMREALIEFASLLELELDFSEEDVEFADRLHLKKIASQILNEISGLAKSYSIGKAFKEGIPVAIAGAPNAGKSTLLNLLLDDDKAIVSDIPGTTRDVIEDTRELNGILFRFVDTAGLRDATDTIEKIGIRRAEERIRNASIVLWIIDATTPLNPQIQKFKQLSQSFRPDIKSIILINKTDIATQPVIENINTAISDFCQSAPSDITNPNSTRTPSGVLSNSTRNSVCTQSNSTYTSHSIHSNSIFTKGRPKYPTTIISAKTGEGIENLIARLTDIATSEGNPESDIIVTNARHYQALIDGGTALKRAIDGIEANLSADFIAQDVREAIHHLSLLTGTISTDTLLTSIFSTFCIGK